MTPLTSDAPRVTSPDLSLPVAPDVTGRRRSYGRTGPLDVDGPAPRLTTEDVVRVFHVPTRTIMRWAAEDGWVRYGKNNRDRRWDIREVQASYTRRREGGQPDLDPAGVLNVLDRLRSEDDMDAPGER